MKGRINKDRLIANIYAVFLKHSPHCGNSLHDSSFTADLLDHRRIKPNSLAVSTINTVITFTAFTNNRSCRYVTGLQRVHKHLTVLVYELCTERTNLFGYESSEDLLGESDTRGMVLKRLSIKKLCTCTVSKHKTVCGRTVVVRGREALIVHSTRTAGCDDNCLCLCYKQFFGFHVHKNRTRSIAVFIKDKLDSSSKIDDGNLSVKHLITKGPHDLGT